MSETWEHNILPGQSLSTIILSLFAFGIITLK